MTVLKEEAQHQKATSFITFIWEIPSYKHGPFGGLGEWSNIISAYVLVDSSIFSKRIGKHPIRKPVKIRIFNSQFSSWQLINSFFRIDGWSIMSRIKCPHKCVFNITSTGMN